MKKLVPLLGALAVLLVCPVVRGKAPSSSRGATCRSQHYTWRNVVIEGGGFVTGLIFHPHQKDLLYARTDVGGAYRWDEAAGRWIPLTDWIGPSEVNLMGIESLAVDPSDPNRLYLAAGTYTRGEAAILRSDDQGRTFQKTVVPFKMGANEAGRFNGERLAVDPHDGRILLFGSRENGLWKSNDRGVSWKQVTSFPVSKSTSQPPDGSQGWWPFRRQPVGIVCVQFDPSSGPSGKPTPVLYVAVSTRQTNLFCSTNAGASWHAVPNQPLGLRPNHLVRASDGQLYLSYGNDPGPNSMTDGAVWKFNPKDGVWTDITPIHPATANQPFGYGAVAVDAEHPATIMVTTFCHWKPHDEIFRSTDGGASWKQIWRRDTEWDHSNAPYTRSRKPHWLGDIEINPFDSNQVLLTTGYGIWCCNKVTASDANRPTRWVFLDRGLEETVPLALISPPEGAHLLSGLGDIDGFRHDNLAKSPPHTFAGPHYGNTEALAFAGKAPNVIARTGTGDGRRGEVRAAYSTDGGQTWTAFATAPPDSAGGGSIAVSADGRTLVWTPRRSAAYFTGDDGTHWTVCAGLARGVSVIADPVKAQRYYAYAPRANKLFISTNGAARFLPSVASFPAPDGYRRGFGGHGGRRAILYATPERKGDLWLAFRYAGLYHSTNGGVRFTKVGNVQGALSLGFGKAAPGHPFPALYLAGKVNQLEALFRSDNAGRTWIRINDNPHQFGWINHVTGDPRIYGRVYFGTGGRGIIYGDPIPNPPES